MATHTCIATRTTMRNILQSCSAFPAGRQNNNRITPPPPTRPSPLLIPPPRSSFPALGSPLAVLRSRVVDHGFGGRRPLLSLDINVDRMPTVHPYREVVRVGPYSPASLDRVEPCSPALRSRQRHREPITLSIAPPCLAASRSTRIVCTSSSSVPLTLARARWPATAISRSIYNLPISKTL